MRELRLQICPFPLRAYTPILPLRLYTRLCTSILPLRLYTRLCGYTSLLSLHLCHTVVYRCTPDQLHCYPAAYAFYATMWPHCYPGCDGMAV